ncbi:hypothetical protein CVS40_9276, partial [Lucilia cuprina]
SNLFYVRGGLRPDIAVNFYKSFIRSKIEYARTTTAHSPQYINRKIQSFQNATLRRCLGLTPSTPVHVIYALACELPNDLRAIFLTVKELLRISIFNPSLFELISDNKHLKNSYSFVFSKFGDLLDKVGKCSKSLVSEKVTFRIDHPFGKKLSTYPLSSIRAYYERLYWEYEYSGYIMATDASISEYASGFANKYMSDMRLSSLSAELVAIREALLASVFDKSEQIVIFTDSKNALLSILNNRWQNCLIINNSDIRSIHLVWVPIRGFFFFSLNPSVPLKPWYRGFSLDPGQIKILNRLLSGYWFVWGLSTCNVIEDANHLIFHCSKYNDFRGRHTIFDKYSCLFDLLKSYNKEDFYGLIKFIKECKMTPLL